jgi:hypothetical protein
MRVRHFFTVGSIALGVIAACCGGLIGWYTEDMFVASVWMNLAVGLLAGGTIYSLAMDDPEARGTALTTRRHHSDVVVDITDPLEAPATTPAASPRTRVTV